MSAAEVVRTTSQLFRHDAQSREASLQSLESLNWGEPERQHTGLIKECYRLRRVPLGNLSVENLRLLIGQDIGLSYLVPLAVEKLRLDPLAEGTCYAGDLLCSVLRADVAFWKSHANLGPEIIEIAERALLISQADESIGSLISGYIREALQEFRAGTA